MRQTEAELDPRHPSHPSTCSGEESGFRGLTGKVLEQLLDVRHVNDASHSEGIISIPYVCWGSVVPVQIWLRDKNGLQVVQPAGAQCGLSGSAAHRKLQIRMIETRRL